jgi:hypothetical protein
VLPAIAKATDNAITALLKAASKAPGAPFAQTDPKTLKMSQGHVHLQDTPPESGVPFQQILALQKLGELDGRAKTDADAAQKQYAIHTPLPKGEGTAGPLLLRVSYRVPWQYGQYLPARTPHPYRRQAHRRPRLRRRSPGQP